MDWNTARLPGSGATHVVGVGRVVAHEIVIAVEVLAALRIELCLVVNPERLLGEHGDVIELRTGQ